MPLPDLPDWKATSSVLHQVVSLVGPVHKALLPHRKNYLHLTMDVRPEGVESQTLPGGGKIHLDLNEGTVTYRSGGGGAETFTIGDHTQRSLFEGLLGVLVDDGHGGGLGLDAPGADKGSLAEAVVTELVEEGTAGEYLTLEGVTGEDPLVFDAHTAETYADTVYSMFTALSRFRARLEGAMTPLIVWPEHFDLSTLWFPPSNPEMDDHKSHLSFGFAPFTPGQYEYPYFYAYAYPYPDPFDAPALPSPASWHQEGWRGAVLTYEDMALHEDHESFVEETAMEIFKVLEGVL